MADPRLAGSESALDLYAGCAFWLRSCHACVSLLGLAGIFGSGARPVWTVAAAATLVLVYCATARRMCGPGSHGRLRLFADGNAVFQPGGRTVAALQRNGGWMSRWFCVVPLQRLSDGWRFDAVVCRSLNDPDAYRRLLVQLRMREPRAPGHELTWP